MSEETEVDFNDPIPLGMVLCENVSREVFTGKFSLIGLFGAMITQHVPAAMHFYAYATLTNVRSDIDLKFYVVDEDGETIAETPPDKWIVMKKPADVIAESVVMTFFPKVEFPRHGSYFVQLWNKKRAIMERTLLVLEPSPPPSEEKNQ